VKTYQKQWAVDVKAEEEMESMGWTILFYGEKNQLETCKRCVQWFVTIFSDHIIDHPNQGIVFENERGWF
jgi:hypothetical protein